MKIRREWIAHGFSIRSGFAYSVVFYDNGEIYTYNINRYTKVIRIA